VEVVGGGGGEAKRLDRVGADGDDAFLILEDAFDDEEGRGHHGLFEALEDVRRITLEMPVSSSMLRTNPLAVPGRWRAITALAMRTRLPLRRRDTWTAGTSHAIKALALMSHRVAAHG
jgi:hypothetical protein